MHWAGGIVYAVGVLLGIYLALDILNGDGDGLLGSLNVMEPILWGLVYAAFLQRPLEPGTRSARSSCRNHWMIALRLTVVPVVILGLYLSVPFLVILSPGLFLREVLLLFLVVLLFARFAIVPFFVLSDQLLHFYSEDTCPLTFV